ncbi:HD domain-containing phosphohydrolase [Deinococcus sp. YIM 134068]|uniref:HD-GYP domain-containing protein n=1 Tax=Deinococcus lichenicola TaxID=3118910 RepID=UPI002F93416F
MFDDLDLFGALTPFASGRPAPKPAAREETPRTGLRQLLLEAQPAALFLLDGAGLVLEVGGAWEAVTGLRPGEATGQPLHRWLRYERARHPGALRVGQGALEEVTLATPLHTHIVRVTWGARGEYVAGTLEPLAASAQHAFRTAERLQDVERALDEAVHFLGVSQDAWQSEHIRRIVDFAERLAQAAHLSATEVAAVRWGAALHDIGKARVPQAILQKPGPLDPLEYEVILQHPVWGVQLLADLPFLPVSTVDAVRHHHERWDGGGYPLGLTGHRIPLAARIVAVADVFDALTSVRPYKSAWTYQDAVDHLITESGRQFDPELTRLFVCEVLGFTHLEDRFDSPAGQAG